MKDTWSDIANELDLSKVNPKSPWWKKCWLAFAALALYSGLVLLVYILGLLKS